MNFVQVYLLTSTSERVIAKLREDVFAHLVRLSPGFFTEQRTGELTSRLSADLAVLQTLLARGSPSSSRQVAVPRRRHRAAHAHASAAHDDDARRRADRRRARRSSSGAGCAAPAPGVQDRVAESHGHGRRGVLADPHRAELRARGGGDAPLWLAALPAWWTSPIARAQDARDAVRHRRLRRVRRRGRRALAGRTARARRRADAGRARVVPPARHHRRGGGRLARRRCSAAIRKRSARRSACSSCSHCSRRSPSRCIPCRCAGRVRGAVALERRALPLCARAARGRSPT